MLENVEPQTVAMNIASLAVAVAVIKTEMKHVWKRLDEHREEIQELFRHIREGK